MKNKIKKILEREQFYPSLLGMFVNPFYFARKGLVINIQKLSHFIGGDILDIGCGNKPYQQLFKYDRYIGLDIDSPHSRNRAVADYFYTGDKFPLDNESFDSVIISQVLEHVFSPDLFLDEVNRVLKNDGKLLVTVPFVWDEHEQPFDYARYSSFGIKFLLENHGFVVVRQEKSISDIRVIFQLLNGYIYKVAIKNNKIVNLLIFIFLITPVNFLGTILSVVLPSDPDLYLDNIVLAEKIHAS